MGSEPDMLELFGKLLFESYIFFVRFFPRVNFPSNWLISECFLRCWWSNSVRYLYLVSNPTLYDAGLT